MDFSLVEKFMRPSYYKKQSGKQLNHIGLAPQAYFQFLARVDVCYSE